MGTKKHLEAGYFVTTFVLSVFVPVKVYRIAIMGNSNPFTG